MKVSATELANDSKAIIDAVIHRGEKVEIQRHGKTVAEIVPKVGISGAELLRLISDVKPLTEKQISEFNRTMNEAGELLGYAGCD